MITNKTLKLSLKSLRDFAKKRLPDEELIELDERDECPLEIVRHMCSPDKLGIQLLFVPEEYGGFGGGAFDVYWSARRWRGSIWASRPQCWPLSWAAIRSQSAPLPSRRKYWLSRIADEGLLFAYGATEPERGQRSWRAEDHCRPRDARTDKVIGLQDQRQQAVDQQWRDRRCVHGSGQYVRRCRVGSLWKKAPRASLTMSPRTSTAFV